MEASIEHLIQLVNQERAAQESGQLVVAYFLRDAIKNISQSL